MSSAAISADTEGGTADASIDPGEATWVSPVPPLTSSVAGSLSPGMALPFTAVGARTTASSTEAALVGASHMPAAVASETTTSDVAIAIAGLVSLRIVGRS